MFPLLFEVEGCNVFCPPILGDLINNDCFSTPIKHNNAQQNVLNMFSSRALLGPTERRIYSTRETPALRDR